MHSEMQKYGEHLRKLLYYKMRKRNHRGKIKYKEGRKYSSFITIVCLIPKVLILLQVVLVESSKSLGGWVSTLRHEDGSLFERGPRSIRGVGRAGYNTLELVCRSSSKEGNIETSFVLCICLFACMSISCITTSV